LVSIKKRRLEKMRKLSIFLLIGIFLISFVSAETTFFEGELGYRDDYIMGSVDEEIIEPESVELLEDPFSGGGGGYFPRENYNQTVVCDSCFEFLRETINEKRALEYNEEELEILIEEINADLNPEISMQQLGYIVENFEDECDSPLPLLGAVVGGRDVDLLSPFMFIIAGAVLVFIIILYFVVRILRKLRTTKNKSKRKKRRNE